MEDTTEKLQSSTNSDALDTNIYLRIDDKLDQISKEVAKLTAREEARDKAITILEGTVYGLNRPSLRSELTAVKIVAENNAKEIKELDSDLTNQISTLRADITAGFKQIADTMESRKRFLVKALIGILTSGGGGAAIFKVLELLAQ